MLCSLIRIRSGRKMMNAQPQRFEPDPSDQEEEELLQSELPFVLKKLRPRHKDVCALIAQGVPRSQVAAITSYTPEYVSALMRQPVCVAYITQLNESVGAMLELQYGKVVTAIGDVLESGNAGEKMKAARMHAELTKRIGSRDISPPSSESSNERLTRLAERLTTLVGVAIQQNQAQRKVINGTCKEVPGQEVVYQQLRLETQEPEH